MSFVKSFKMSTMITDHLCQTEADLGVLLPGVSFTVKKTLTWEVFSKLVLTFLDSSCLNLTSNESIMASSFSTPKNCIPGSLEKAFRLTIVKRHLQNVHLKS